MLFGSAVESKDFNDLDVLVIGKDKHIKKTLADFQKTYSVKIHLIQTNKQNLTKSFIKEIGRNPVTLFRISRRVHLFIRS